jgi:flagellar basal-body rod protein FlgB
MKSMLFDNIHNGIYKVLELRKKQHALTVGNIANTDTPNYKAKYIRFDELLSEAMQTEVSPMKQTMSRHLVGLRGDSDEPDITTIEAPPWAMDGNSVQIEREMIRLRENSVMFNAAVKGIAKRLSNMTIVISKTG